MSSSPYHAPDDSDSALGWLADLQPPRRSTSPAKSSISVALEGASGDDDPNEYTDFDPGFSLADLQPPRRSTSPVQPLKPVALEGSFRDNDPTSVSDSDSDSDVPLAVLRAQLRSGNDDPNPASDSDSDVPLATRRAQLRSNSQFGLPVLKPNAEYDRRTDLRRSLYKRYRWMRSIRRKRLRRLFPDITPNSLQEYTDILKQVEEDYSPKAVSEYDSVLGKTLYGAMEWTAKEKEILFDALGRKGKGRVKEIADAIGTKSALEVMEYLRIAADSLKTYTLLPSFENRYRPITMSDIPAAAEISEKCCAEQDVHAEYLTRKGAIDDELIGRQIYSGFGIIGKLEAQKLDKVDFDTPLQGNIQLAAGLFRLPMWIKLSTNLFMNFGGERADDHWENFSQSDLERPSIAGEAIMEFAALTISFIRRVVQSSIFCAEARNRTATLYSGKKDESQFTVRYSDMKTALEMLNLKRKRPDFVEIARANHVAIGAWHRPDRVIPVKIFDYARSKKLVNYKFARFHEKLKVFEVKPAPGARDRDDDGERTGTAVDNIKNNADEIEEDDNHSRDKYHGDDNAVTNPAGVDQSASNLPKPELPEEEFLEDQNEREADAVDREQSRLEELFMWSILEKRPPRSLRVSTIQQPIVKKAKYEERKFDGEANNDRIVQIPPSTAFDYKTVEGFVDWRDRTLYRSEWEQYSDLEELANDLALNSRKRRRVEAGDDSSTEDSVYNYYTSEESLEDEDFIEEDHDKYSSREQGHSRYSSPDIVMSGVISNNDSRSQPERHLSSCGPIRNVEATEVVNIDDDNEAEGGAMQISGSPESIPSDDDDSDNGNGEQDAAPTLSSAEIVNIDDSESGDEQKSASLRSNVSISSDESEAGGPVNNNGRPQPTSTSPIIVLSGDEDDRDEGRDTSGSFETSRETPQPPYKDPDGDSMQLDEPSAALPPPSFI
ncbi:hypothetical protein N7532_006345 [Penicillium argentinense]|uniref:Myb-like domain-containing protein n=1 Tax=Penicillium argentinense TaxID=1131581 RepID=A0A9W9KAN6_9EURO|nr:uncharacterized protein N7532_006345 [Penicillium argentinense]KAJ5099344.1 hypothetical protein N7532_006345 [Penicillium argentinense]